MSNAIWSQPGNVFSIQQDLALFRSIEPGDAIEKCCLAGAIGSDDAVDRLSLDFNADLAQRVQTTKAFCDFFCNQNSHCNFSSLLCRFHGCSLSLWWCINDLCFHFFFVQFE